MYAQGGLAQGTFGVGRQPNGGPSVERRTKQLAGRLTGCLHRVGRARPSNAGHAGWFESRAVDQSRLSAGSVDQSRLVGKIRSMGRLVGKFRSMGRLVGKIRSMARSAADRSPQHCPPPKQVRMGQAGVLEGLGWAGRPAQPPPGRQSRAQVRRSSKPTLDRLGWPTIDCWPPWGSCLAVQGALQGRCAPGRPARQPVSRHRWLHASKQGCWPAQPTDAGPYLHLCACRPPGPWPQPAHPGPVPRQERVTNRKNNG